MGIFSEEELAADAVTEGETPPEPKVEETPDQSGADAEARARGPDGKFVAKDEEQPQEKGGQVPQGALHAEREKRKTAEAEAKRFREQLDAIAAMRAQVASRQPEPLPESDDAGVQHLRERLAQLEQAQTRTSQSLDNQRLDQAESQQLQAAIASSEAEFRQTQADYDNAVQYVIEARARELQLHGLNQVEISQAIADEAQDIVRSAIRQGRSPAEMAYQIAQSRGYRPEATQTTRQPQGGAAATVAAIAAAKAQGRSLGQASGTTPQTLNADALAAMTDDEFAVIYSTPEGRRMIDEL